MRTSSRVLASSLLVVITLAGCGKNNPVSTSSSSLDTRTQVLSVLTQTPGVIEDGLSDSQDSTAYASTTGLAAIRPVTFWRTFSSRSRSFEFAYSDTDSTGRPTRAIVTIRTELTGTLHIAAAADSTSPAHEVTKPIDEVRLRRIDLRRVRLPHDVPRDADCDERDSTAVRWRIAGVSAVFVGPPNRSVNDVHIVSVRIQSGVLDTTITDPLAFVRLRRLPPLPGGQTATVTVTTTHTDDVVVVHKNDRRFRLVNNGDGTYSGTFRVPSYARGLWHFAVDVLSHPTLFDDAATYDSNRWVFPYVIGPNRMDGPDL